MASLIPYGLRVTKPGEFTVIATSSDKKIQQSEKFTVYSLPKLNNWADENIDETNKAYDNLKEAVAKIRRKHRAQKIKQRLIKKWRA